MLTTHTGGSFETGARAPAWLGRAKTAAPASILYPPKIARPALIGLDVEDRDLQAEATEREFTSRRRAAIASTRDSPVHRVAAYLAATSRLNEYEGRDPDQISDLLPCGIVADLLGLDVETLACTLVELERRCLVAHSIDGWLHLPDRRGLERFSPAASSAA